jgi:hypothetical protein
MKCLHCKKRLWTFFSKERLFCSKPHEVAYYQEGLSAINRLMEFASPPEPPPLPVPRNRNLSAIYSQDKVRTIPIDAIPPLSNFVVERGRPKPIPPDPAAAVRLEAMPFAGTIRFPSTNLVPVPFRLASVTEPGGEIEVLPNETTTVCHVQSKPSRRAPSRNHAASSSRKKRANKAPAARASRQRSHISPDPFLTLGDSA